MGNLRCYNIAPHWLHLICAVLELRLLGKPDRFRWPLVRRVRGQLSCDSAVYNPSNQRWPMYTCLNKFHFSVLIALRTVHVTFACLVSILATCSLSTMPALRF